MGEEAKRIVQSPSYPPQRANEDSLRKNRKMNPVEPSEIATFYRRVCNRDFHDVKDKYHTPEQRRRSRGSDQYMLAVHTNDTVDAFENEHELLSFNLPTFVVIIEQFVCSLSRVLQWDPLLSTGTGNLILNDNKRQGFVFLFAWSYGFCT